MLYGFKNSNFFLLFTYNDFMNPVKYPHLSHAPITEAVLGIVCNDYETEHYAVLKSTGFLEQFTQAEKLSLFEAKIDKADIQHRNRIIGFQHKNPDASRCVQFRSNGFSYHGLNNYPGWDTFISEALQAYAHYKTLRTSTTVEALGVRFINTIALADDAQIASTFSISLHQNTKQKHFSIFAPSYRFLTHFDDLSCQGIVNFSAAEPGNAPKKFILDIDITARNIAKECTESQLKEVLANMRIAKNILFFSIVKKQAWEKYK